MSGSVFFGCCFGLIIQVSVIDRIGYLNAIRFGLAIQTFFAFFVAFMQDKWSFAIARFLTGVGIGIYMSPLSAFAIDICPKDIRGFWNIII